MSLDGWLPIRAFWDEGRPMLDWCYLGSRQLSEPFFDHTIDNCLQRPFNQLFRRQTSIDTLLELERSTTAPDPSGFIFHLSRCGSTLLSQMLATLDSAVVVSEASVFDGLFRITQQSPGFSEDQLVVWFRALVRALIRPRLGDETVFIVKHDPWHTCHLSLFRAAFPDTPRVFVYRNPVEVLVSLSSLPSGRVFPGVIPPSLLGMDLAEAYRVPAAEYQARVLRAIFDAALENRGPGCMLVNHLELPDIAWQKVAPFFKVDVSAQDIARMRERSNFRANSPITAYQDDCSDKKSAVSTAMQEAADSWLAAPYEELERARRAGLAP